MPETPDEPDDAAAEAAAAFRRATRSTAPARKSRPRGRPVSYSDDRDPQRLGDSVDRLMRDQGWQDRSAVAEVMAGWSEIVGADLAAHVVPVGFVDGELALAADSTTWATQVRLLVSDLHRAIDRQIGSGVVVRIRITGPQAPSWVAGQRRVKGRGPRDTYG